MASCRLTAIVGLLCGLLAAQQAAALAPTFVSVFGQTLLPVGPSVSWRVSNSATPSTATVVLGQPVTVTFTTTFTQSANGAWQVAGEFTVTNPDPVNSMTVGNFNVNLFAGDLSTRLVPQSPPNIFGCTGFNLPPSSPAPNVCSFQAWVPFPFPPSGVSFQVTATNLATGEQGLSAPVLTSQAPGSGGVTSPCATASIALNPGLNPFPTIQPLSGGMPPTGGAQICQTTTYVYVATIAAPVCGSSTLQNTATVSAGTSQTQSALAPVSITNQCGPTPPPPPPPGPQLLPPIVTISAAGSSGATVYKWQVIANVNGPGNAALPTNQPTTLGFTINTVRTLASAAFTVAGSVVVTNPNAIPLQIFSVTVFAGATGAVPAQQPAVCPSLVVNAGAAMTCTYTMPYSNGPTAGTASAQVVSAVGSANSQPVQFFFPTAIPGSSVGECATIKSSFSSGQVPGTSTMYLAPISTSSNTPPSFGFEACGSGSYPFTAVFQPTSCAPQLINVTGTVQPTGQPRIWDEATVIVNPTGPTCATG